MKNNINLNELEEEIKRLKDVRDNGNKAQRLVAAMEIAEINKTVNNIINIEKH